MAIGQKYYRITDWFRICNQDRVMLTFRQLNEITPLPNSAYSVRQLWANSGQSFSNSWLSAGYKVCRISMDEQWVEFERIGMSQKASKKSMDADTLDELLACGSMCIDAVIEDPNHRYRSWEHCYKVFNEPFDGSEKQLDYLALHLAWYLASWGMLRNSFLQDKDYKIHKPVVLILLDSRWDSLRGMTADKMVDAAQAAKVMELAELITQTYERYAGGTPTDTLLTKILLGTIGCVPAYDRFFKEAVRKMEVASGMFGAKSIIQLGRFYIENQESMELLHRMCPTENVVYPPAKIIDMCFFGYGMKHDKENKEGF